MKHLSLIVCILVLFGCDSNTPEDPNAPDLQGAIEAIDAVATTITVQAQLVLVDSASQILDQQGIQVLFANLRLGDFVSVSGTMNDAGVLVASSIERDEELCVADVAEVTFDNLNVPAGETCTLTGTSIKGNLFINDDAIVTASGIDVGGNIQAEGAASITVDNQSVVGGNIQANQGQSIDLTASTVDGDLQLEDNQGAIDVSDLVIGGNLQINNNEGGVTLNNNQVASNMQCQDNNPAPSGAGNTAGAKEEQCVNL